MKINIKAHLLLHLKNAEHFDLMEAIITNAQELVKTIPLLSGKWDTLEDCFQREDDIYKRSQKQEETQIIEDAEKRRTRSFRRIKQVINYNLNSTEDDERAAAQSLQPVIQLYKDATYASYVENSALITNFLDDLCTDKHKAAVRKLELMPLIVETTKDNEEFKVIYRERSTEMYNSITALLAKARKESDDALIEIADAINSLHGAALLEVPNSEQTRKLGDIIQIISGQFRNAERVYARRVPSYTLSKDGEDGESGGEIPSGESYYFDVKSETYPDSFTVHYIDKNPDTFRSRFKGANLSGALLYAEEEDVGGDTNFSFEDYLYDTENQINGLKIHSTREIMLPYQAKGAQSLTAVLVKNGEILIRFSLISIPPYMD